MTAYDEEFSKQRNAAYDRILSHVQKHIDALQVPLTASLTALAPSDARDAAEKDVWTLFRNGIQHLKNGGQMDAPGNFGEAVRKASLRSAPIAATLGVKAPKFDDNYAHVEFDSGAAEAVWRSRRLLEAVQADADKSAKMIRAGLGLTSPLIAPETAPVVDPQLAAIFGVAQKAAARKEGEDMLIAGIRRQAVLSFNLISDLYAPMTETLKNEIAQLFTVPPLKPAPKGQTFDL